MSREILVFGEKTFKIIVSDESKITFSPWSPPSSKAGYNSEGGAKGTLRIYEKGEKSNILAVFSGVTSFRESSLNYSEQVMKEEGETIWKNDNGMYSRNDSWKQSKEWTSDPLNILTAVEENSNGNG